MTRHPAFVTLVRGVNALFFLATAAYCLLAYIPFAYQVFLKPEVLSWIPDFLGIHVAVFWLVLLLTTLTLKPFLGGSIPHSPEGRGSSRRSTLARWLARAYVVGGAAIGAALIVRPIMSTVGNAPRSFAIALAALVPPVWLAAFDHVAAVPAAVETSDERQALRTCLVAAAAVWAIYAIGVPFRLMQVVGIDLPRSGILMSIGLSAVMHLFVFMAIFLALAILTRIARVARSAGPCEYWLLVGAAAAAIARCTYELIFASLTFVGVHAAAAAMAVGVMMALGWSGVARWHGAASAGTWTARQLFFAPFGYRGSRLAPVLALAALPLVAFELVKGTSALDWNFVIQKLGVVFVWLVAFASVDALTGPEPSGGRARLAVAPLVALGLFLGADVLMARERLIQAGPLNPDFLLDRYSAVDLSFRLIRDQRALQSGQAADFYAFLQANTLVAPTRVTPSAIQFAHPIRPATRPPHIFLFLIDSLRRDYLSAYNPQVTFTPSIDGFASDSFVFRRAFTRYSGTGLSVPAIWAGGMLVHMSVPRPFDGRDSLYALLNGAGYRPVMGIDSVMRYLLPAHWPMEELDRRVSSMQTDFCRTTRELAHTLADSSADPRPVFSYTLPQNVHIAVAYSHKVPAGVTYPGFFAPVADQVRQVDRCFGEFIDFLKHSGRYDDSIVILTADHGDSLGEEGRWGHGYFVVPEVMQVPLIVRLPPALRDRVTTDLDRVAFSTDITPTLYALLGNEPTDLGRLFGSPLFVPQGKELPPRRHESFLVGSSYGAVYGMLRHNGRKLYVADATDGRDNAYDMTDDGAGHRIAITQAMSSLNRRLIAEQLNELAALNHLTPQP